MTAVIGSKITDFDDYSEIPDYENESQSLDIESGAPEPGSDAEKCFYGNVESSATCLGSNSCQVRVDDAWTIDNDTPQKYIQRRCAYDTFATALIASDSWVCFGDNCNDMDETDPPPYDKTPK